MYDFSWPQHSLSNPRISLPYLHKIHKKVSKKHTLSFNGQIWQHIKLIENTLTVRKHGKKYLFFVFLLFSLRVVDWLFDCVTQKRFPAHFPPHTIKMIDVEPPPLPPPPPLFAVLIFNGSVSDGALFEKCVSSQEGGKHRWNAPVQWDSCLNHGGIVWSGVYV